MLMKYIYLYLYREVEKGALTALIAWLAIQKKKKKKKLMMMMMVRLMMMMMMDLFWRRRV